MNCRVTSTAATRKPKWGRKWRVCRKPRRNEKRLQNFSRKISYDKSPCRWFCTRESNKYCSWLYIHYLRLWSGLNWTRRDSYIGGFLTTKWMLRLLKTSAHQGWGYRKVWSCKTQDPKLLRRGFSPNCSRDVSTVIIRVTAWTQPSPKLWLLAHHEGGWQLDGISPDFSRRPCRPA